MKNKKLLITVIVLLCIAVPCGVFMLTPTGKKTVTRIASQISLVRGEWDNIADFFREKDFSSDERITSPLSVPDPGSSPELESSLRTVVLPSPYNSALSDITAASVSDTELFDVGEGILPDSAKNGYSAVPMFVDRNVSGVMAILRAHGIETATVTRTNTAPAGEVFAMRFAGLSDSTGYYINPSVAVTLYVSAPKKAAVGADGDNLVYLTFDDGPNPAHTEAILDILDTYGIRGTFFTLGESVEKHPALAAEITARGHNLGCHTMTHVYSEIYSSTDALSAEVDNWEDAVENAGIVLPESGRMFRFPGGSVGTYLDDAKVGSMIKMLEGRGYYVYDWNAATNDAVLFLSPDDKSSYDYIKESFTDSFELCLKENNGKSGAPVIILMHETTPETPELLKWLIEKLIDGGYSFGNLSGMGRSWTFDERNK